MMKKKIHKKKLQSKINKTVTIIFFLLIALCYGIFDFLREIPGKQTRISTDQSDGIVVLTGGNNRLKQGIKLLINKKAKKLFISGVYRGNDVLRLLAIQKQNPDEVLCCINIGYNATSTHGNAAETAEWVKNLGYKSIRLVTANYHMPRSLVLFRSAMPDIRIIPHPVYPSKFKYNKWWLSSRTINLVIGEYFKYIIANFTSVFNVKKFIERFQL